MNFLVDCMLGKLAKWLKILGFDTLYYPKAEDAKLLTLAQEEGRILLTRDRELLAKSGDIRSLFVESENWRDQVRQVVRTFDLRGILNPFSRCLTCNAALKSITIREARNLVNPFVAEQGESFALCPSCGRIFWKGSHHQDMSAKIENLIDV